MLIRFTWPEDRYTTGRKKDRRGTSGDKEKKDRVFQRKETGHLVNHHEESTVNLIDESLEAVVGEKKFPTHVKSKRVKSRRDSSEAGAT